MSFAPTLVRPFHEVGDMETIGRWLRGARRYYLQAFVDSGDLVGGGCAPFTPEEMEGFLQAARPFFQSAAPPGTLMIFGEKGVSLFLQFFSTSCEILCF